jgi:RNA polymerase sigma-70 factor (ECF subfamily)
VADDVELAESVSFAMLTVLETLTPTERAVFVLREVFDLPYGEIAEVVDRFVAAVTGGDLQALMDVLAPDVVLLADGGGIANAVRVPVIGAKKVANLLRPFPRVSVNATVDVFPLNGGVGVRIDDEVGGRTVVSVEIVDGRITRIFAMRNPEKLGWLAEATELRR